MEPDGFPDYRDHCSDQHWSGGFFHENMRVPSIRICLLEVIAMEAGRTIGGVTTRLLIIGFGTISLTLTAGWYVVLFRVASWAMGRGHP
jgi:hypothetical protein